MDKLKEIAKYGKLLHEKDLVIATGGNISTKVGDNIIIKKRCTDMSSGSVDNFIEIPLKEAGQPNEELSTETPLHIASYNAREDVGAVIHVHSPAMIAVASKIGVLESVSYEFDCMIGRPVPVIEYVEPGSSSLAKAIASHVKNGANAVLMKKHGATVVGKNLKEAYFCTLALERACTTYLLSQ